MIRYFILTHSNKTKEHNCTKYKKKKKKVLFQGDVKLVPIQKDHFLSTVNILTIRPE